MVGRAQRQARLGWSLTAAIAVFCLALAALGALREWAPVGLPGLAVAQAANPGPAEIMIATPPADSTPRFRHDNAFPDPFTLVFLGVVGLMILMLDRTAHRRPLRRLS